MEPGKTGEEVSKRRTFAIISHPDAGKTTVTEKLLLLGGAIQIAGTVKARKSGKFASSDWLEIEKQRGISVNSSVMTFDYHDCVINLLDTPGHKDFSEDTYRVLTAVDSALMLIDCAKGVEEQTRKLMEVCRLRNTPIITLINKMDRDGREPLELLEEIESVLGIRCAPMNWPIAMGKSFAGNYHLYTNQITFYHQGESEECPLAKDLLAGDEAQDKVLRTRMSDALFEELCEGVEMARGICEPFDKSGYLNAVQTPVFFGSALHNFGVQVLLDTFCQIAPAPLIREAKERLVEPHEENFSAFVFKIQANMDLRHRDRLAFLRICSGNFVPGMKVRHMRLGREIKITRGTQFLAKRSTAVEQACAGDIIGVHDPGIFKIGDTLSENESITFKGLPHFRAENFMRVILKSPLKGKQLVKGLYQLSEEGATQVFRPFYGGDLILGAVGSLQFDVVKFRLLHEYKVEGKFENLTYTSASWFTVGDEADKRKLESDYGKDLAYDSEERLVFLAKGEWWYDYIKKNYASIRFHSASEFGE